uniref:Wsv199-like protein n=1 Tax=Melicertus latisulcatus pemonivirus TaxID=2984278 RepID=A0A9C7BHY9_9VIRU|nr:MAG: wsv199-like protein [Melicertus latisulcatus pemonivirus]
MTRDRSLPECQHEWNNAKDDEKLHYLFNRFRDSILAAAENQWEYLENLCLPEMLEFVRDICEWVVQQGSNMPFSYYKLNSDMVDREGKSVLLMGINMARVMSQEMAETFMVDIVRRFCKKTLGVRNNINHMNNFVLAFHYFSPKVLSLIYSRLLSDNRRPPPLVLEYLSHTYTGDIEEERRWNGGGGGGIRTFDSLDLSSELFKEVMVQQISPMMEINDPPFLIAVLVLQRIIRNGGPVVGRFLLAATHDYNFEDVHQAVTTGRIDINSCFLDKDTGTPFLLFLGHLSERNFRRVLKTWLPLISDEYDVATKTLEILIERMEFNGCIPTDISMKRESLGNPNRSWTSENWILITKYADESVYASMSVAMTAIYINNMDILRHIIRHYAYTHSELKALVTYAADNPMAIRELTLLHEWLAKVPVTPDGKSILHYAISDRLPNFTESLAVHSIRKNLNILDVNGKTPLMVACLEGRKAYFNDLLNAGARVDVISEDGQTVFHCLADSYKGEEQLNDLIRWKKSNPTTALPRIEIRQRRDNLTALQLALLKNRIEVAKSLMVHFGATASTLYGRSSAINTADMMLLRRNDAAVEAISECQNIHPSIVRIMYACVDGKLDKPRRGYVWTLFRQHNAFPMMNRKTALEYLKRVGKEAADGKTTLDVEFTKNVVVRREIHGTRQFLSNSNSPFILPDRPKKPLPGEKAIIIRPHALTQPSQSRPTLEKRIIFNFKGKPFTSREYRVRGKWISESHLT